MTTTTHPPPVDLEVEDANIADDESVISEYSTTSDSSAVSGPALEDVDSDTTPVRSDDDDLLMTDELFE